MGVGESQTNYNILFWGLPSGNSTLKNIKVTKDKSGCTTSIPKIDRDLTVEFVADKIVEHFPTLSSGKSDFLQKNRRYVELLSSSEIINNEMVRMMPTTCPKCVRPSLLSWPFKAKTAYFLSMGQLKKINIPVRTCPTCRRAFYPQMYEHGLFTIHNKAMISVDFLLDFDNMMDSGSGLIESIKNRIMLMGQREGISVEDLKTNITNVSKDTEKMCCAVLSLLVTGVDMDAVVCLICGVCPKIINSGRKYYRIFPIAKMVKCNLILISDGNTKDAIRITDEMKFNYDDQSEPMDLHSFKNMLLKKLMKRAFFQNEPKLDINMLKLPLIIAPSLLGSQVNNDVEKKSLLDKTIVYKPEVFTKFTEIIDNGQIDILGIDDMNKAAVVSVGKELGLEVSGKSAVGLRNELKNMSNHVMAGQGACHAYTNKRGRTGGFTDVFCDHMSKVGSKVQSMQESVRFVGLPDLEIIHVFCLNNYV